MKHLTLSMLILTAAFVAGCEQPADQAIAPATDAAPIAEEPCVDPALPRGVAPRNKQGKRIWARKSYLWVEAPKFVVEGWVNLDAAPDMNKKYVLVEFWNTWCPPCRRSLAKLQHWHEKFGKDLTIIAVCDESLDVQKKFFAKPEYSSCTFPQAIDSKMVMKKEIGVFGVPHAILYEPSERVVIWEGFPLQPGHELTDKTIENILTIGRKNGDIPTRK